MKKAIVHLKSVQGSPYSQSKNIDKIEVPAKNKERPDDYEQRTWRHRIHSNAQGRVEMPGVSFAAALRQASKLLSMKIPGKGNKLYTKHFESGVMVLGNVELPVKAEEVPGERLFVPADGTPGGGKRVYRTFPRIDAWEADVVFDVLDDEITEEVFERTLNTAGMLVGVGRFRPERRGTYGRFAVESIRWEEI